MENVTPQFLASLSTAGGMSPVHEMSDMSKELISFMKTEFDQLDQERFHDFDYQVEIIQLIIVIKILKI